jgi:hypothetical protein
MSKFRKVSEIENIPSFMEQKFVGASYEAFDDPYAELKQNSTENRIKISKQTIGNQKTAENFTKSWEKIQGPSVYEEPKYNFNNEDLFGTNTIRRAGSDYDEGLNARTTTSGLKAYSADEYMNAMLSRSASIFNPDMIAISEEFLNSQASTSEQSIIENQRAREAKTTRHKAWEESQLNNLRQSSVVSSRAHSILRTSSDNEFNSTFGMIDPSALDNRETVRIANQEKNRNDRMAIKKNIQSDMTNKSQMRAKTVNEIYNSIDINFDDID